MITLMAELLLLLIVSPREDQVGLMLVIITDVHPIHSRAFQEGDIQVRGLQEEDTLARVDTLAILRDLLVGILARRVMEDHLLLLIKADTEGLLLSSLPKGMEDLPSNLLRAMEMDHNILKDTEALLLLNSLIKATEIGFSLTRVAMVTDPNPTRVVATEDHHLPMDPTDLLLLLALKALLLQGLLPAITAAEGHSKGHSKGLNNVLTIATNNGHLLAGHHQGEVLAACLEVLT